MNTQTQAFVRIQPTARETRTKILEFAIKRGPYGLTADEVSQVWCCDPNHTAPRIHELVKAGHLVATGRTRPTRSGSSARVLVARRFAPDLTKPTAFLEFGDLAPESEYPG